MPSESCQASRAWAALRPSGSGIQQRKCYLAFVTLLLTLALVGTFPHSTHRHLHTHRTHIHITQHTTHSTLTRLRLARTAASLTFARWRRQPKVRLALVLSLSAAPCQTPCRSLRALRMPELRLGRGEKTEPEVKTDDKYNSSLSATTHSFSLLSLSPVYTQTHFHTHTRTHTHTHTQFQFAQGPSAPPSSPTCFRSFASSQGDAQAPPSKRGWLLKWTNYMKGFQKRYFVLEKGVLAYYR